MFSFSPFILPFLCLSLVILHCRKALKMRDGQTRKTRGREEGRRGLEEKKGRRTNTRTPKGVKKGTWTWTWPSRTTRTTGKRALLRFIQRSVYLLLLVLFVYCVCMDHGCGYNSSANVFAAKSTPPPPCPNVLMLCIVVIKIVFSCLPTLRIHKTHSLTPALLSDSPTPQLPNFPTPSPFLDEFAMPFFCVPRDSCCL